MQKSFNEACFTVTFELLLILSYSQLPNQQCSFSKAKVKAMELVLEIQEQFSCGVNT